tara:strand:- start:51437 stop:51997 length:561 start_codon:yes stop_codon:yes gene_type:complete
MFNSRCSIIRSFFIYCLLTLAVFTSIRGGASPREDAIKSGFIYNFARYSQGKWFNETTNKNYYICSFNAQFIASANHTLKARKIKNLPVIMSLLSSQFDNISHCNTLFMTKDDVDKWSYLVKQVPLTSIMLVGEFDDFIATGGHINFFIVGGKVRFEVNPDKLKQSGILMSSKVLRLGRTNKANSQ